MSGSVFWSIIFFLMLITLGLDSTFGGLEAMITALCDEYPKVLARHREIFVGVLLFGIYLCALPTTTYVSDFSRFQSEFSNVFCRVVCIWSIWWTCTVRRFRSSSSSSSKLLACVGCMGRITLRGILRRCWGTGRGYSGGSAGSILALFFFWWVAWCSCFHSRANGRRIVLQTIFIFSLLHHKEMLGTEYKYPEWSLYVGYAMTASSILCIPIYIVYKFAVTPGSVVQVK